MSKKLSIWVLSTFICISATLNAQETRAFNFYGSTVSYQFDKKNFIDFDEKNLSPEAIRAFYNAISTADYNSIIAALQNYKEDQRPDDWLYYQLVRAMAQQISPKADNYLRYTLYKWYFMIRSGYTPLLAIHNNMLLFYIRSNENVYNIPLREKEGRQYVCLNYHDYGSNIDFNNNKFSEVVLDLPEGNLLFSYKIHKLPDFNNADYVQKDLQFSLSDNEYHFKIKVNPQIKNLFVNYPTVDYENYLNMPMSHGTYTSLIPVLKKQLKGKSVKQGVYYLMQLTRYAFVYEPDTKQFGQEKRLSPEQSLLYENNDCEDRVIFFFNMVKEIYNLPMIVLVYPHHVTIAVSFDKEKGTPIMYNGRAYYVCEPTPQKLDLSIGQLVPELKKQAYQVAYVYLPN